MKTAINIDVSKPISPGAHSLIDYSFGLALAGIPQLAETSRKTSNVYYMLAGQVLLYSLLTKQPYAALPVVSFKTHKKIDIVNLCGLALFAAYKGVRKNKRALAATIGLTLLGVTTVLLTDWKRGQ